ncbi:MAG: hypothetical protein OXH57_01225, partial [Ekhidna sp.]|nr:hypothetical protein [Ekhidna sp.]
MNKIFGYTKKGGQHWFQSDAYLDKEIESIKDPEGGSISSLPAAVPSPFARIDLVKTAFRNIIKSPNLTAYNKDGNVIAGRDDEKLVSHALDVAEIVFNIDNIKDKIKIIVWDKKKQLEKLKSGLVTHRRLAETLELYLGQDKRSCNFDLLKRLYIVEYNHKIIGCTSPATLFFATANDLSHVQIPLKKRTSFDTYAPIYKRDSDFQQYLYLLFEVSPTLKQRFTVLHDYLRKNLRILDKERPELYDVINKLIKDPKAAHDYFKENYAELDTGTTGDSIEIIGVPLRKRKRKDKIRSDFFIRSTKQRADETKKPLVLQNRLNKSFSYIDEREWDSAIKVPFVDNETILEERQLPGSIDKHPYLTVSDFLEPYLIRLIYPIDKDKFFDGDIITEVGSDSKGYILPLKQRFFDYFNSGDLLSSSPDKPKIKMVQGAAGSVKVSLRIPIAKQGESISLERIYYQSPEGELGSPDELKNKGAIVEHQFGITLFPFIKTNDKTIGAHYRIQLVDRDIEEVLKNTDYDLTFFSNSKKEAKKYRAKKQRSNDHENFTKSDYYVLNHEFDFIQIRKITGVSGIIIPKWKPFSKGSEQFAFAVDFGTTNTHLEYKIGNETPKPFDISTQDIQIATLFHPTKTTDDFGGTGAFEIRDLIEKEFIPRIIGNGSEFKFPHRTVIAESHNLDINTETFALADFNIPFIYEQKHAFNNKNHLNLKWAKKEEGNEKRVRAFFENLMMLMRNKVLNGNGDLSKTQFVWFYPSSMKPARKAELEKAWRELFEDYFNPSKLAVSTPESLAPFFYFKNKKREIGFRPAIAIDIGGGTTDIVVFQSNKPLLLTSFKFAANAIFGDGYSEHGSADANGIIKKYFLHYKNLLEKNKLHDLSKVLNSIEQKKKAEDINTFFFSIENNPMIKDPKLFSYNSLLSRNDDYKILFVYLYAAIIYHIAVLMKEKKVELPKYIIFSGTGSKILNIISDSEAILSDFSKLIFENIYKEKFNEDGLSVETEDKIPKEVTCKGGLMMDYKDEQLDIRNIKTTLTCLENQGIDVLTYSDLNEERKAAIVSYIKEFNYFFLSLNRQFSFSDYFDVSEESLVVFKKEVNKHLREYLEEGLDYNKKRD